MTRRGLRSAVLMLSALTSTGALLAVGCDDEDPSPPPAGQDASADSATMDATTQRDAGFDALPDVHDAGTDTGTDDGGADADAALPPLCTTYGPEIDPGSGPVNRYTLIAESAIFAAIADCAFGDPMLPNGCGSDPPEAPDNLFCQATAHPPSEIDCFGIELAAVAGCEKPGGLGPVVYDETALDVNSEKCVPASTETDAAVPQVRLGFWTPAIVPNGVTDADVERMIAHVRAQAIAVGGFAEADADRLVSLLRARKSSAVTSSAAGHSRADDSCDLAGP